MWRLIDLDVPIIFSWQTARHIGLRRFCFTGDRGSNVAATRQNGYAHYQRYTCCQGQSDEASERDVRCCLSLACLYYLWLPEACLQIKFVKFFAWEEQWIKKIIEARQVEIDWLKKCVPLLSLLTLNTELTFYPARNVNIYYGLLWGLVPTLIAISSFFTYVITGHVLSVSVAFTVRPC